MMDPLFALVVHFIFVHGPDGQAIELNVKEISSLRDKRDAEETHFAKDVNCICFMTNGKHIGVKESCEEVLKAIKESDGDGEDEP
jgi:uncharacterized protein YlzI (FlbEa/FlbD family)